MSVSLLLRQLLDYVLEQDKAIDPRGFKLSTHKGFIKGKPDLQGLPSVDARGAGARAVAGRVPALGSREGQEGQGERRDFRCTEAAIAAAK